MCLEILNYAYSDTTHENNVLPYHTQEPLCDVCVCVCGCVCQENWVQNNLSTCFRIYSII